MATERGCTSRLVNLARKHDSTLLSRAIDKHHQKLAYRGLRDQANYLVSELGDFAENVLDGLMEEDQKIDQLSNQVQTGNARDRLICAVFNDLAKQMQDVVMKGPEAQLRYLTNRYGLDHTQKLVKTLVKRD
jgi:outer membrane murein-binding lipoprotein Lpp